MARNRITREQMTVLADGIRARLTADSVIGAAQAVHDPSRIVMVATAASLRQALDRLDSSGVSPASAEALLRGDHGRLVPADPADPVSGIGLLFGDGRWLLLDVDPVECAHLKRAAEKGPGSAGGPSVSMVPMKRMEAMEILFLRRDRTYRRYVLTPLVLGGLSIFTGMLLALVPGPSSVGPETLDMSWRVMTGAGGLSLALAGMAEYVIRDLRLLDHERRLREAWSRLNTEHCHAA